MTRSVAWVLVGLAALTDTRGPAVFSCGPDRPPLVALDLPISAHSTLRALALLPPSPYPRATLVVVHGGGWDDPSQDRHGVAPVAASLACPLGVAALSAEYRLVRAGGAFPAALDDLRATLRAMPATLGMPGPRVLLGESAGGQLALLAAATEPDIAAVVAVSAPSDLSAMLSRPLPGVGGAAARAAVRGHLGHDCAGEHAGRCATASPITGAHRLPPVRVVHSPDDLLVDIAQARSLVGSARDAGRDAALWEVSRAEHPCPSGHSYHGFSPCVMGPVYPQLVGFLGRWLSAPRGGDQPRRTSSCLDRRGPTVFTHSILTVRWRPLPVTGEGRWVTHEQYWVRAVAAHPAPAAGTAVSCAAPTPRICHTPRSAPDILTQTRPIEARSTQPRRTS